MAGPPIPVEDSPRPRLQLMATDAATALSSGNAVIDGSLSAGSKVIVAASSATDVAVERKRIDFPAGVYRVRWVLTLSSGSHLMKVRLAIQPPDMATAHIDLRDDVFTRRVYAGIPEYLNTSDMALGAISVYLVAVPIAGATLSSCKGEIDWEAN